VDDARGDLKVAIGPGAQGWVSGRAHVELARLATRSGDHTAALSLAQQAESLCRQSSDPPCVKDAQQLIRSTRGW
jgi:hypothetical protein